MEYYFSQRKIYSIVVVWDGDDASLGFGCRSIQPLLLLAIPHVINFLGSMVYGHTAAALITQCR